LVITKKGRSGFGFTPLHRVLRNLGVSHCVVTGGAVHGCVEDTVREGAGLGYQLTLVPDALYRPNSPTIEVMKDYVRFKTTAEVLAELDI
jgi:nicotinamidase-related amidase